MKRAEHQQNKRDEAEHRQRHYNNLTPAHRLEQLEARGHGNCAEADRLRAQIKES